MKKALAYLTLLFCLIFIFSGSLFNRSKDNTYANFGSLPIQANGRIKPMDTLARNSLMILRGKQSIRLQDKTSLSALSWLMDVMMRPELADTHPSFRIDNDQVLGLMGYKKDNQKYFSYNDLKPHFSKIAEQQQRISPDAEARNHYERAIADLTDNLSLYHALIHAIHPPGLEDQLQAEYASWILSIPAGMHAIEAQATGKQYDEDSFNKFIAFSDRYLSLSKTANIGITIPTTEKDTENWNNIGQALLESIRTQRIDPAVLAYAQMTMAYKSDDQESFNQAYTTLQSYLSHHIPNNKIKAENFFNTTEPFYKATVLYVSCFLIIIISWLLNKPYLSKTAFTLLLVSFILHSLSLGMRTWLQGRPPVTNLYSSAIFTGWAAVLISIIFERIHKNGIAIALASIIGFATLIIAHNLAMSGDTLEMMRAVLDSNFWLSTHVVIVTLGYSAMFLAGILGCMYILSDRLNPKSNPKTAKSILPMAYATICFAMLFSFVGTMLGGIWADQSWGRFWGWDPKENGALLIVLWCAIILHAKWGKIAGPSGFMLMCIFGNIVTAWSWFGTNMLGVGLHSYGFINSAFTALLAFILSQLAIIAIGLLPNHWRVGSSSDS